MFQPDPHTLSGPYNPVQVTPVGLFIDGPDTGLTRMRTDSAAVFIQIYQADYKVIAVAAAYVMLWVSVNRIANLSPVRADNRPVHGYPGNRFSGIGLCRRPIPNYWVECCRVTPS